MVKLIATKRFLDTKAIVRRQIGDIFEVKDDRGQELLDNPNKIVRLANSYERKEVADQPTVNPGVPQATEADKSEDVKRTLQEKAGKESVKVDTSGTAVEPTTPAKVSKRGVSGRRVRRSKSK